MKRNLISVAVVMMLAGCAMFRNPVPSTKISGEIGGQKFSFESPKNTVATNVMVEVDTNHVARLSIGYISTINDSNVVTGAYAGAANLATAVGEQINKGVETGVNAAGTALGAAAKTAVK